jgi:hypothetical protein
MFPVHWYELRLDRPLLDPTYSLEHTSLQLSCRIAGLHVDKFEWYRNGELIATCYQTPPASLTTTSTIDELDHGSFHVSYDTLPAHFIALLTVDQTSKQRHEGTYECRASNAHYHISSSCQVLIQPALEPLLNIADLITSMTVDNACSKFTFDKTRHVSRCLFSIVADVSAVNVRC